MRQPPETPARSCEEADRLLSDCPQQSHHGTKKQLIARVNDDLHAGLKAQAEREGRSLNALVVEALTQVIEPRSPVQHRALRERAGRLGMLYEPPGRPLARPQRTSRRLVEGLARR